MEIKLNSVREAKALVDLMKVIQNEVDPKFDGSKFGSVDFWNDEFDECKFIEFKGGKLWIDPQFTIDVCDNIATPIVKETAGFCTTLQNFGVGIVERATDALTHFKSRWFKTAEERLSDEDKEILERECKEEYERLLKLNISFSEIPERMRKFREENSNALLLKSKVSVTENEKEAE